MSDEPTTEPTKPPAAAPASSSIALIGEGVGALAALAPLVHTFSKASGLDGWQIVASLGIAAAVVLGWAICKTVLRVRGLALLIGFIGGCAHTAPVDVARCVEALGVAALRSCVPAVLPAAPPPSPPPPADERPADAVGP